MTYDILGSIYMSHAKVLKTGAYSAHQCGAGIIREAPIHRPSGSCSHATVPGFRKTGLPISSRSAKSKPGIADSGAQGGLHGQTPLKFGSPSQAAGQLNRAIFKRPGDAGARSLSPKREAWLSGILEGESRCCTILIGWPLASSLKSMSFWFQRRLGLVVKIRPV